MGRWEAANVFFHLPLKYNAEMQKIKSGIKKKLKYL